MTKTKARALICLSLSIPLFLFLACNEPPPKVASIPPQGMSLRVFAFGASAQDARNAFEAARQTNQKLRIVREGGDGEVLVGLENDSPKCVAPTALCSFKVVFRIKDNQGKVVNQQSTAVSANAERCNELCDRALNQMVVKVLDAAATNLKIADPDAGVLSSSSSSSSSSASIPDASDPETAAEPTAPTVDAAPPPKPPTPKKGGKPAKPEPPPPPPPKAEPALCVVGHGPHLPTDEAEKRAAQVEALKRLNVIEQDEYDCLRKAYLDRL
jgi:hypothetical protein